MTSSMGRNPELSNIRMPYVTAAGDNHAREQRHLEQQGKPDSAAEEFGQIGRHGGNLADRPHRQDDRPRKLLAAHLRQVPSGNNPELGGESLE